MEFVSWWARLQIVFIGMENVGEFPPRVIDHGLRTLCIEKVISFKFFFFFFFFSLAMESIEKGADWSANRRKYGMGTFLTFTNEMWREYFGLQWTSECYCGHEYGKYHDL